MARHFADVAGASCAAQAQSSTKVGLGGEAAAYELALLDDWMAEQDDIPENRQAAIRRLIAMVCGKAERN